MPSTRPRESDEHVTARRRRGGGYGPPMHTVPRLYLSKSRLSGRELRTQWSVRYRIILQLRFPAFAQRQARALNIPPIRETGTEENGRPVSVPRRLLGHSSSADTRTVVGPCSAPRHYSSTSAGAQVHPRARRRAQAPADGALRNRTTQPAPVSGLQRRVSHTHHPPNRRQQPSKALASHDVGLFGSRPPSRLPNASKRDSRFGLGLRSPRNLCRRPIVQRETATIHDAFSGRRPPSGEHPPISWSPSRKQLSGQREDTNGR
ncbi:hypothetical protein LXA43DRAFT_329497 [Ganoderma leucocontextum]|nr:hypothetical protein LXA43DRAFT_329354 [Ganoderma leucocontextum]KAI1792618.1 hypothetical protein LXA43DRAFT_329415 [Ganoderma leucocontextum]KAI1792620.1 hypothetical protein LXA43DRAFT_329497 [Ganoderma leucocontextum]